MVVSGRPDSDVYYKYWWNAVFIYHPDSMTRKGGSEKNKSNIYGFSSHPIRSIAYKRS
jgi:hypothetical protein